MTRRVHVYSTCVCLNEPVCEECEVRGLHGLPVAYSSLHRGSLTFCLRSIDTLYSSAVHSTGARSLLPSVCVYILVQIVTLFLRHHVSSLTLIVGCTAAVPAPDKTKLSARLPPSHPPFPCQGDDKFIFVGKAAWSSGITVEQALQVCLFDVRC